MATIAAVIAHFDAQNALSAPFVTMLQCLREVAAKIVVVTTSDLPLEGILRDDPNIVTIRRPNIGYDFYSYRVGLSELENISSYDAVFVGNSSFLVTNRQRFISTLEAMVRQSHAGTAVGLTHSFEIQRHLQSFMILLHIATLQTEWMQEWVHSIEPRNTKDEVITTYEIGLSRLLLDHGVTVAPMVHLTPRDTQAAWIRGIVSKARTRGIFRAIGYTLAGRFRKFNPTHVAAQQVARQCGIVKVELARANPMKLDTTWLQDEIAPDLKNEVFTFLQEAKSATKAKLESLSSIRSITTIPLNRSTTPRIAVIAHTFYAELLADLKRSLLHITEPFDLFLTTPHEADVSYLIDALGDVTPFVTVSIGENRGRDIGPFVALCRAGVFDAYKAILKVHLKKSLYSVKGAEWRESLFLELCKNGEQVKQIVDLIAGGSVGIVGPHSYFLSDDRFWGSNKLLVGAIRSAIGISANQPLGFFAGSMFWFAPNALRALKLLPEHLTTFEPERGLHDGTLAHALERTFCDMATSAGFHISTPVLRGREVTESNTSANSIPVL